jgi:uncharacterized membrane protein YgcG
MILSVLFMLVSAAQGFSPEEASRINSAAQDWTFQFKAFQAEYPSRNAIEVAASNCITGPSDVCALVDPIHRWTSVHFGTATSVPKEDFNLIAASGNSFFKNKDFAGGIIAIGNRTMLSVKQVQKVASDAPVQTQMSVESQPSKVDNTGWYWFSGIFLILSLFIGYFMYRAFKNQKKLDEEMKSYKEEKLEFMNANVNRMVTEDSKSKQEEPKISFKETVFVEPIQKTPYPSSKRKRKAVSVPPVTNTPPTIIHNHHHDNGIADSILISQAIQPRVVVVEAPRAREPDPEPVRKSSSWSSSDSSSYDSGGGGSDWGSSDSGGGFDSGGGGSDF